MRVVRANFHDRPGRGVAGEVEASEAHVVGPAIDAIDDGVCRAFQLVVETALLQPTDDRDRGLVVIEREAADVRFAAGAAYRLMDGLDGIAADAQIAQRQLESRLQAPLRRPDLLGKA
jgi:hypothetical protein